MSARLARAALLIGGCLVLGAGVGLLLGADLGSDGYSTLVNGVSLSLDIDFWIANLAVGVTFVALAAARRLRPGVGTVVQVLLVGATVSVALEVLGSPDGWPTRIAFLVLAFPILALGIATYLGSKTGAGPAEGAALAWDPPIPFRWSYSVVQGGGALGGWLLGATIGVGTIAVILLLGPLIDLAARLLRIDVHQDSEPPG
ncbi:MULTISPECIES: hypothetical protein [Nocardioides]|uniref:Uncharacterized protein n=1 Tax=Nocardioides vastitatis TaxID=2568655 RepID=A0ABW0ZH80_9ACTN|nr:hypothetical protein [Nocardioides sp.]THJ00881.1 hypothetical protein E7Z54_11500 [Nocardioides sp.]